MEDMRYNTYKGEQWYRACDGQALQPMLIVRGRSQGEARELGVPDYGFRDIIEVIAPYEGMERACADRGY